MDKIPDQQKQVHPEAGPGLDGPVPPVEDTGGERGDTPLLDTSGVSFTRSQGSPPEPSPGTPLEEVSPKDRRWTRRRREAVRVRQIYAVSGDCDRYDPHGYAERVSECSRNPVFAWDRGAKTYRLQRADFCRVRMCPVCQWRKSLRWFGRMAEAWSDLDKRHPDLRFLHLTLTVKNCPTDQVRDVITETINPGWSRLHRRKTLWKYGEDGEREERVRNRIAGFLKSVETKPGASQGETNVHLHLLVAVEPEYFGDDYLQTSDWVKNWRDAARLDYDPVVYVNAVDGPGDQTRKDAVLEVVKYEVKPQEAIEHPDWLLEITDQLHGLQTVTAGGVIRKFLHREDDPDEDEMVQGAATSPDEQDLRGSKALVFDWREGPERYELEKVERLIDACPHLYPPEMRGERDPP